MEELDSELRLENSFNMETPNQAIPIYEGNFTIKSNTHYLSLKGLIRVEWTPNFNIIFDGEAIDERFLKLDTQLSFSENIELLFHENTSVFIDNDLFAKSNVTYISKSRDSIKVSGKLLDKSVIGNQKTDVDSLRFTIPNLRKFDGELIRWIIKNGHYTDRSRLIFDNPNHNIILEQRKTYDVLNDTLEKEGGFLLFYNAEYKRKDAKHITDLETGNFINCFSKYLTFINGSRSVPMFIEGISNDKTFWTDYTTYPVDSFEEVQTWSIENNIEELNYLWNNFFMLWTTDKEFLTSVIHWYVEANKLTKYLDGNLILAQTALELIYNWFVIEKGQSLNGKNADNISAANKIRLLLSKLNITSEIPNTFTALQKTLNEKITDLKDGAGVNSYIRNCIAHSNTTNRNNLKLITEEAKSQSLQLCLWYVELSILKILDYKGKYYNRCSGELYRPHGEQFVPWI